MIPRRIHPLPFKPIGRFILLVMAGFAMAFWIWMYCLPSYIRAVSAVANKELAILGIGKITWLGISPSSEMSFGVYHRDAVGGVDSLFDFNLETIRVHVPMLLALIVGLPVMGWLRKLKACMLGILSLLAIDSIMSVVVMTWSYTFLPDHHAFSPFTQSDTRDAVVQFCYVSYNSIGAGAIPIVLWLMVTFRDNDLRSYLSRVRRDGHH